jgi:hypothetical protein
VDLGTRKKWLEIKADAPQYRRSQITSRNFLAGFCKSLLQKYIVVTLYKASGDVLQELDVVATMCARSCMLHPSLQFIAELEVINFPPAINIISSGKRMSTHDKLVSRYGSEFDYVEEDGSTVTHVLVNSKNLKMTAVAEVSTSSTNIRGCVTEMNLSYSCT